MIATQQLLTLAAQSLLLGATSLYGYLFISITDRELTLFTCYRNYPYLFYETFAYGYEWH